MEGFILDLAAIVSPFAVIGGVSLLAVGIALMLLGHTSDEEKAGHRVFWAAEPIPGTEETSGLMKEGFRLAA